MIGEIDFKRLNVGDEIVLDTGTRAEYLGTRQLGNKDYAEWAILLEGAKRRWKISAEIGIDGKIVMGGMQSADWEKRLLIKA